ncbi:MAG TPA: iron ABC transporter permease [Gammaproteobacteria bacterium]|nr:iron ABC transporter permease [Gammaproteobacteria bacterium]
MCPPRYFLPLLLVLALASLALSLTQGSVTISLSSLLSILQGNGQGLARQLILELRLPRTLSAFFTGALLAQAGVLMQVLVRNPLADPYILGISGGAALAALLAMLAGASGFLLDSSAFVGALLAVTLVFGLARYNRSGTWTPLRLLLTGVVLAAGWGALISFILVISPERQLRSMLFWLMGDLGYASNPELLGLVFAFGLLTSLPLARSLNVLIRGEQLAGSLGVDTQRIQLWLFILASLLTASAVSQAGSIGFVGLVIPHMVRLMGYTDHRILIPAASLCGGILLVIADTLARTALAPQQLPVGIITALLGIPLFLYLLQKGQRS